MDNTETVILYRLSALGDVAMTLPAIYSLALSNPTLRVIAVTGAKFTSLFINRPSNLDVIGVDTKDLKTLPSLLQFANWLDKFKPTAFIDLHNTLRSWIIATEFIRRGRHVTMVDKRRHERYSIIKRHRSSRRAYIERYFDVIEKAGYTVDRNIFKGFAHQESNNETTDARRIGIAPFARYATKTYPVELMEQVVARLAARGDCRLYLFGGGQHELSILNDWRDRYGCVDYVSGSLTLAQEVELMGTLDMMVSMDSANMHLASLAGTRVISVWGGTTPACGFIGWRQSHDDAILAGLDCQPCSTAGTRTCPLGTMACMRSIDPDTIVARILTT